MLGRKRSRPADGVADVTGGATARAFSLPPCFMEKDFFEGFPLIVLDNESDIIRRLDDEGRRKHLASIMAGVMKMAEMVVVLVGEGASSSGRVKELELEHMNLQAKTQK